MRGPWFAIGLLVACATVATLLADDTSLTEVQRLKAENHGLKIQVAQLQAQLADVTARFQGVVLSAERATLEADFRQTLQPPANTVFDWTRYVFTVPDPPSAEQPPEISR